MIFHHQAIKGFTLIELVVVIVISVVLAAFAAAQINTQTFNALGFADQAASMVRYAQKTAISQRRTVVVIFPGARCRFAIPTRRAA